MEEMYGWLMGVLMFRMLKGAFGGGVVMVAGAYKSNPGIMSEITMLLVKFSDVLVALSSNLYTDNEMARGLVYEMHSSTQVSLELSFLVTSGPDHPVLHKGLATASVRLME